MSQPSFFVAKRRSLPKDLLANTVGKLHMLIAASISLVDAIEVLANQEENVELRECLKDVCDQLIAGHSLSGALSKHRDIFPIQLRSLVKVGESTGSLHRTLDIAAKDLEKEAKLVRELRAALSYPLVVGLIAFSILGVLLLYFVPMMAKFSASLQTDTSPILKALTSLGSALSQPLVAFALIQVCIGSVALFSVWRRTKRGARQLEILLLSIPVVSRLMRCVATVRLTRILFSALSCGCTLMNALGMLISGFDNSVFSEEIESTRKCISEQGATLAEALENCTDYDSRLLQLVSCAEESGTLTKILPQVCRMYEDELSTKIQVMVTLIEPLVLGTLGAAVAGITLMFFLPMTQLIRSL